MHTYIYIYIYIYKYGRSKRTEQRTSIYIGIGGYRYACMHACMQAPLRPSSLKAAQD